MSMSSYVFVTSFFFFFNDTATTEIYTLSLHDALPISGRLVHLHAVEVGMADHELRLHRLARDERRSEEHTSELQSHSDLVCRLLLEKKKKKKNNSPNTNHHTTWEHVYYDRHHPRLATV